mmetsp:Transcript_94747/g.141948  ORF Transcript_94747/g.141948 Transcript_94747/m.141948 type:complete len:998 (-) Transcript_94747:204-3197(-)
MADPAAEIVVSCGPGTTLDSASGQCLCEEEVSTAARLADCERKMQADISTTNHTHATRAYIECVDAVAAAQDPNRIFLAGIMDTTSYTWCPDIFEFTVEEINKGRWGILEAGSAERVEYTLKNSECDETMAAQAYWEIRTQNGNRPPDGIVGARCSGASTSLARISGLQRVPHVSPTSNTAKLTSEEFPYFSRLVAPNNEHGEVGAMIALLRHFGWDRVTILATDTQFAKDLSTEFNKLWAGAHNDDSGSWTGVVAHSDVVRLEAGGEVGQEAIDHALAGIPNGHLGSRIIVLLAHNQHAFEILERAHISGFQEDTIWVGPSAWVGREQPRVYDLPSTPGYMGLVTYRNRNEHYQAFLRDFQEWQRKQGKDVLESLPAFAAETADAIVAMATAIAGVRPDQRRLGTPVVDQLRSLDIEEGVSGRIQLTPEGDRRDPTYSFFSAPSINSDGSISWTDVGAVGTGVGSVSLHSGQELCFAEPFGCNPDAFPQDSYPAPPIETDVPGFLIAIIVCIAVLFVLVSTRYFITKRKKDRAKQELAAFRDSVVNMRAAECDYMPRSVKDVEEGGGAEQSLAGFEVVQWCWKETDFRMTEHDASEVYGDPFDCWVKYTDESNRLLEAAYKAGKRQISPLDGYIVDLRSTPMKQTKIATKFEREVMRVTEVSESNSELSLEGVKVGDTLPTDLTGEPQMVLIEGDVVQISKQRDNDGWAFGTKLHHANEAAARELVKVATGMKNDGDTNVFADTGWFQLDSTRVPTPDDLEALKSNVGDTGALDPPSYWAKIKDPTVVQRHMLKPSDGEYDKVCKAFMSTLHPSTLNKKVKVVSIERVQNLAMFQSYIVKRQTICYRETGHNTDPVAQRKAVERFERSWLWHGTNAEVMEKILQQGFNRSFCGKNATAYGKGVYFARDASYSAYPIYAVPDTKGHQYMMACRVTVGEYCKGRDGAPTPDIRDHKSHSLYDSTVGLLGNDTMSRPSIFVTYHDAQAYPEYLIAFKMS